MRRFALALLASTSLAMPAMAQWGGFIAKSHRGTPPVACLQGSARIDGCPGAPSGTAQQSPSILGGYVKRPPWNAAGVDFRTGPPAGTTLADPATISMTGVTVNSSAHTVTVDGNNVTLNAYDFGLANGWYVIVNGANDTIQNSHFKLGTNQGGVEGHVLDTNPAASNFTFLNNEVDGNNINQPVYDGLFYTVGFSNSGTLTVQYNFFHNSGGDMVDYNGVNLTSNKFRYNYFQDIGYGTEHSDTIQFCGSIINAGDIAFNVVNNQSTTQSMSGEGALVLNSECGPSTGNPTSNIKNTTTRNNTLITKGPTDNFLVGQTITQDAGTALGDHNATYDNYGDPTGVNNYTQSPWFPTGYYASAIGTPGALHDLMDMTTGFNIPVPPKTAPVGVIYYVYPDSAGYTPCQCDIFSIAASPLTGNITTGNTVTFTVTMDAATTVTGTPSLSLNCSGCVANYSSGTGTKNLKFVYTVGASDQVSNLSVTKVNP
ncbi:MAG TPA: hypothetical protein VIO57_10300 [Chloroflexota bacterium]|jgi:hypothetical protein